LTAHAQTLVAADFLSVDTIFLERLYVLLYMRLASRRVLLASCKSEPNAAWVTQQARNLSWTLEEEGIKLSVLIHNRDKKFAPQADRVFHSQGARVILTPLMAPKAMRMSSVGSGVAAGNASTGCLSSTSVIWRWSIACTTTRSVRIGAST
jgi:putative transposase